MAQDFVSILLVIALILPFVGAIIIRVLSRLLPPRITIIVAALTAIVIVSAVLSLASISISSLRIANLTLMLPVAPSIDRSGDFASEMIDEELIEEGTATLVPEVTITPIPTMLPTVVVSDTSILTDTMTLTDTTVLSDTLTLTDTTLLSDTTTLTDTTTITTPTPEATIVPTTAPATSGRTYTVQPGDSLSAIAAQFNVTVKQIINANPTLQNPDNLAAGQELTIP
ncbi:MAG: LysM peptidoglycan-binding domain-containing protein [Roseiflexaceae bacterium]|nr:LysM peptidoglycan-binding domain-containing protein [Chloroflexaceae bacterium]MCE2851189.1 LysM peptidoglycan-binding domain-containing protein [Chloroflexaceae bacterium]